MRAVGASATTTTRLSTERVRSEARLAKLEYQRQVLRDKWAEALAAMRKSGANADKSLIKSLKQWAATIELLEERVAREKAALDQHRGDLPTASSREQGPGQCDAP